MKPNLSIRQYLEPSSLMPLWEWAEQNVILSARQSTAFPGPYRVRLTPYAKGILQALDDPNIYMIAVMAGAQTSKTTLAYVFLAHCIASDPGPCLVSYPSSDLARTSSQTRIQPLIEDSPKLAVLLPNDRKTFWQKLQYRLNGCVVTLSGANSPAQLSSRPIRYLILDEVDKFPTQAAKESDPVSLAVQRTKTYFNRKILLVSTPTTPDGPINRHYLRGDQRKYYVPCPYCGCMQYLVWTQVKWPKGKPEEAVYKCTECDKPWTDVEKNAAVALGEWRGSAKGEVGIASFQLSSLYARWTSLPDLARKFLRTRSSPIELKDMVNSDLAEPFVGTDMKVKSDALTDREADYEPEKLYYRAEGLRTAVFGGVDVQQNEIYVIFRQFTENGDSALIEKYRLHTWSELEALSVKHNATGVCIDCRYRTSEIYDFCLQYKGYWPVIGVAGFRVPALFEVQSRWVDEGRRGGGGRSVDVIVANSNALLTMLSERISRSSDVPQWRLYRGAASDATYVSQMTAAYRSGGVWVNPRHLPDHFVDAEKLCLLAAEYAGFRRTIKGTIALEDSEESKIGQDETENKVYLDAGDLLEGV